MAELPLIEEFHLTLSAPRTLTGPEADAIRRALAGRRLQARLASAARAVCRKYPALRKVRLTLSR